MSEKMTFKEYHESKFKLKNAGEDSPKYFSLYEVNKYCKIPLLTDLSESEKIYYALKPKDKIKILWEVTDLVHPIPKRIFIYNENDDEEKYYFSWNLVKVNSWLDTSTFKK